MIKKLYSHKIKFAGADQKTGPGGGGGGGVSVVHASQLTPWQTRPPGKLAPPWQTCPPGKLAPYILAPYILAPY